MNQIHTKRLVALAQVKATKGIDLSVILPVYDEAESLPGLLAQLFYVLDGLGCSYEVLVVNDGSKDGSIDVLKAASRQRRQLRVIDFTRNYGQTAALMAGFEHSRGEIVVTLDADLQNDPSDIPMLIDKIKEGYDVVSGWRADRKDAPFSRNFLSRVANALISHVSGVRLRDYGCTLKAYRRDIARNLRLYGEMHRLIPIYASWMGAKVVEVPVKHHARKHGVSKYGLMRVIKVVLDLAVVKFLENFLVSPIYLFGGFGFVTVLASFGVLGWALALKLFAGTSLIKTPLPILAAILFLIGCISTLMGLLAELMTRTYFESQSRRPYLIRERINEPTS